MNTEYEDIIKRFDRELPHFEDGRINYSNAKESAVLNCFVASDLELLLLKRSDKVGTYRGKWNSIGGYLDEAKPLDQKVKEELNEELGVEPENIESINFGIPYEFHDKEIDRIWHIFPVLIKLKERPEIKLDWEHVDFKWIKRSEIANFDVVPRLEDVLASLEKYLS